MGMDYEILYVSIDGVVDASFVSSDGEMSITVRKGEATLDFGCRFHFEAFASFVAEFKELDGQVVLLDDDLLVVVIDIKNGLIEYTSRQIADVLVDAGLVRGPKA